MKIVIVTGNIYEFLWAGCHTRTVSYAFYNDGRRLSDILIDVVTTITNFYEWDSRHHFKRKDHHNERDGEIVTLLTEPSKNVRYIYLHALAYNVPDDTKEIFVAEPQSVTRFSFKGMTFNSVSRRQPIWNLNKESVMADVQKYLDEFKTQAPNCSVVIDESNEEQTLTVVEDKFFIDSRDFYINEVMIEDLKKKLEEF